MVEIAVHSDTESSAGALRIKAKLVELFGKLRGIRVAADSPEVLDAYALFVEVWENKRGAFRDYFLSNEENIYVRWRSDAYFFDGIDDDLWREELDEYGNEPGWDRERVDKFHETVNWSDPQAVARTWAVVLQYRMMDYRYLYLMGER
ncbi:MAG: hypothetical protein OXI13_04635 [Gammaproteobacteria bacterium]|nr:hypothetical protein [Gammaproteobacteria bacterium]